MNGLTPQEEIYLLQNFGYVAVDLYKRNELRNIKVLVVEDYLKAYRRIKELNDLIFKNYDSNRDGV